MSFLKRAVLCVALLLVAWELPLPYVAWPLVLASLGVQARSVRQASRLRETADGWMFWALALLLAASAAACALPIWNIHPGEQLPRGGLPDPHGHPIWGIAHVH